MKFLLIGAGGHGKVVADAVNSHGNTISCYVDPKPSPWLNSFRFPNDRAAMDAEKERPPIAMGLGGIKPKDLTWRLDLYELYKRAGFKAPPVIHSHSWVSPTARLDDGVVVLAGAIVQPGAAVGACCIINTGAIVEHDCVIDDGCHVAPGAVVLGGCSIGRCCLIGAGAVLLPGSFLPNDKLVPSLTRWPPS